MAKHIAENKQQARPAALALADGRVFWGQSFGAQPSIANPAVGEVVFNTSMYGYQEILTDPSYAGQMICFTYPHIGNVGCNEDDSESAKVYASACIVRDISPIASNFRAQETLSQFLSERGIAGLSGIDTRALVLHLRDKGAQMGAIASGENLDVSTLVDIASAQGSMEGKDYVQEVSCKSAYTWNELPWTLGGSEYAQPVLAQNLQVSHRVSGGAYAQFSQEQLAARPHVVVLDCGVKKNILRLLLASGFRVSVLPATTQYEQILSYNPDALFLSNGPGDPATLGYIIQSVRSLVGRLPIFGICLGHQILAQVYGAETYKLKFGHRGGNHPVKELASQKIEITVQNHGFAVADGKLTQEAKMSHINLNDGTVEGLRADAHKAFSVQYHPEASPGPHDALHLFKRFFEMVVNN